MRSREATRARTQTPPTHKCHRRDASPCSAPTSSPTARRLPPAKARRSQRWRQSRQRGSRLLPAHPAAAARAGAGAGAGAARRALGWGTWSGTAACSAGSYAARRRRSSVILYDLQVYEDDVCLCILDSHPLAPGHSLIIPKCHFPSLEATPPPVIAAMCSKVPLLSNAIMKATQCDSFNLVVNNGAAAGQVIFHTHFHIIPRRSGDKLWPTESFRRRSLEPNETSGLVSCIKEQLDSSPDGCKTESSSLPKET